MFPTKTTFGRETEKEPLIYRWKYFLGPWSLVLLAWSIILIAFATKQTYLIDHNFLIQTSHFPWWLALILFLLAWQLMTVAMMLPSTLSTLVILAAANRTSRSTWAIQGTFITAYAGAWTLFALAAFVGDTLIHFTVDHWEWFYLHSRWIGATLCFVAAAYQCSPLKRQCLDQCRSQWHCCIDQSQLSWRLGWQYGLSCVGTCWAIMLVMFGIGMNNLLLLVLLTGIVVLEKEIPADGRLKSLIGIAFLLWGILWLMP